MSLVKQSLDDGMVPNSDLPRKLTATWIAFLGHSRTFQEPIGHTLKGGDNHNDGLLLGLEDDLGSAPNMIGAGKRRPTKT